jgi:hypothetical protein
LVGFEVLGRADGGKAAERGGSASKPSKLRSFDPNRIADLEYQAWVGYYLGRWPQVLIASVRLG